MAQLIINRQYIPREADAISPLFIILARSDKAEDVTAADTVLQLLSGRFPQAALVNISMIPREQLQDDATEEEQDAWLQPLTRTLSDFVQQQQARFQVEPAATALIGVGVHGSAVLELTKLETPLAGRVIAFGSRYLVLPSNPISVDQTVHLFHAAGDEQVEAKHSHIAKMALDNLDGDCTIDLVQGITDSLDPILLTQMRTRFETCIPLRILREVQAAGG